MFEVYLICIGCRYSLIWIGIDSGVKIEFILFCELFFEFVDIGMILGFLLF